MNCHYCNDSKFDPADERRPCAHCADACNCCPNCQGRALCESCGEPPCTYCEEANDIKIKRAEQNIIDCATANATGSKFWTMLNCYRQVPGDMKIIEGDYYWSRVVELVEEGFAQSSIEYHESESAAQQEKQAIADLCELFEYLQCEPLAYTRNERPRTEWVAGGKFCERKSKLRNPGDD